jgi:hypothetical protein
MERRQFVAASCGALWGGLAGCVGDDDPDRAARIDALELANHRRGGEYEFAVRIESGAETVFEATRSLGPAGSGDEVVVFENPVEGPGTYAVRVEAGEHVARIDTRDHVDGETACLYLNVYLGETTLHAEHVAYDEC